MKVKSIWIACMSVALGCGASKEEEKEKLDKINVGFDPAPGSYSYKPWVILTKPEDSLATLYAKAPGETEFKSTTFGCIGSPYPSGSASTKQGACVEVKASGTLAYYLESSGVKSEEKSVEYVVNLTSNAVSLESKSAANATAQAYQLSENETFCKYDGDDKLQIVIQATNLEKLTSSNYGYILLQVKNPGGGISSKYTKDSDTELGIAVKPTADDVPTWVYSLAYTTKPGVTAGSWPESYCETKVDTSERVKVVKGTFECSGLRSWKSSTPEKSDEPFDKIVNIKGTWQCDRFR